MPRTTIYRPSQASRAPIGLKGSVVRDGAGRGPQEDPAAASAAASAASAALAVGRGGRGSTRPSRGAVGGHSAIDGNAD